MQRNNNIIHWNCQGYRSKYEDLICILHEKHPAIMLLQETMLSIDTLRPPNGYQIYNNFNIPTPGHGLATLVRNDIPHMTHNLNTNLQATAFRIRLSKLYTVCNIYISPNAIVYPNDITSLVDQLPPPVILCGDFNTRHHLWDDLCTNPDARSRIIENLLLTSRLLLLNTGTPTHFHIQSGTSSAIDLSICSANVSSSLNWSVMSDTYGSDHYPIIIEEIDSIIPMTQTRYVERRADWNKFRELTKIDDPMNLVDEFCVDELMEIYNQQIISAADISIPKSSPIPRPRKVPWWNIECARANDERKRKLRRFQHTNLIADKIAYNRARAIAKQTKHKARQDSWQSFIDTLTIDTPMSKIWKRIAKIRGIHKPFQPPYLIKNNAHISDPTEVAECLASHYQNISSNASYSPQFQRKQRTTEQTIIDFSTSEDLPYNNPLSIVELKRMLRLCGRTATGEDQISYAMIKHSHSSNLQFLLNIMNKIFTTATMPSNWLTSIVLSFPKPGKPSTVEENYRPISLTSCVGKLMEKILNARLTIMLESSNKIPKHQFGFRKMHSTIDALNKFSSDISTAFKEKQHVLCVSFDLQKAYDTTWRYGILSELHKVGLRGKLPQFIVSFLQPRRFKTKVSNTYSTEHLLTQGVPQGSVLSCTLFSLAINGILATIPNNIRSSLYVDDLLIYCCGNYVPSIERRLQCAVNSISKWTNARGFQLSTSKTKCIHFHRKRKFQPPLKILLNNIIIPCKESIRYLGMTFDYRLSWKEHLKQLKADCMKRLDILKCITHTTWGSDRTIMLRLYRAIIGSKLDYASAIYNTATESDLRTIDPVHNAALRLCTGAYRSSPVVSIYADSAEPPLAYRRNQLILQYHARTMQHPPSAAFSYAQRSEGTLEHGPGSTLADTVNIIQTRLSINVNTLPFSFRDIPTWLVSNNIHCELPNYPRKNTCNDSIMRGIFYEHVREHHGEQFHIYTDGAKNETGVGCAAVSLRGSKSAKLMSESSIYTAELYGLLQALQMANEIQNNNFAIFSDSRSVLHVIDHYDSTHPLINKLIIFIIKLQRKNKQVQFCWCPAHVGIQGNERADAAATLATQDDSPVRTTQIPFRDWYPIIKRKIKEEWELSWQNTDLTNKLRNIKDTTRPWSSSNTCNRLHSIIITRLRIGHTKITHQYLMENRNRPYCEDCIVPLSVKHLLAECPTHQDIRRHHYPQSRDKTPEEIMTLMLTETPNQPFDMQTIIKFLQDIGMYREII